MRISIATFADLGKKKNLKTVGIMPLLTLLAEKKVLHEVICRIDTGSTFSNTKGAISLFRHYAIKVAEKVAPSMVNGRAMEEKLVDQYAAKHITGEIAVFHPEYFFTESASVLKQRGVKTVGIVTMAHLQFSHDIEKEESKRLGLATEDTYYRGYIQRYGNGPMFDYLIAISPFAKKTFVDRGFPEEKIFVAAPEVSIPLQPRTYERGERFRVLYAAQTNMLKGLEYLLEAWNMLEIPNKELLLVGGFTQIDPGLRKKYDTIIAQDKTIRDLGLIPRESVIELYRTVDVLVMPSLSEGGPRVVFEAMACGLPVVTTEHASYIMQDGVSGFVVPIRDPGALREKIEFLYTNPDSARKIGRAGQAIVRDKKPFAEEVYSILTQISEGKI